MFGLTSTDILVIVGYCLLMILLGFIAMKRIKNQEDFFLGGRRFGKFFQTFASFGQATSSENAVGAVAMTYKDGAGGIWSQLQLLWTTPFYWFTAPWYRRMRILTLGDFFRERYQSQRMVLVYSVFAAFYLMCSISLGLKAVGATITGITLKEEHQLTEVEHAEYASALRLDALNQKTAIGELTAAERTELDTLRLENPRREFSMINETALVWLVVLVVFIYGLSGGLEAAVWSDAVQGTLIIVLSFMLLPLAIDKLTAIHGVEGLMASGKILHEELPGYFFSLLGSAQNADFTWYFIIALSLMATINVAVQANQLTANASAKDEWSARVGFTTGTLMKRVLTVVWGLVALYCYALYSRDIQNPDLVWGHATRDLLSGVGYGLVGLMIACLLAALQSTASTLMISSSSLLTHNVYAVIVPHRSERHYVWAGRVAGAFFLIIAALLCTSFDSILEILKFIWEFNAVIAATFWCGLKWRRATRRGAWASIGTAVVLFIVIPLGLPLASPGMRSAESLQRQTAERIVTTEYHATSRDVREREQLIANWSDPAQAPPAPLSLNDPLTRSVVIAPKAMFWSQGISEEDGQARGQGMFLPEMYVLDKLFDLSGNPYALNETIRYAYKIFLPFAVLILVSLAGAPDKSEGTERFFLRMRTPVRGDHAEDDKVLQAAYADPASTEASLLFPHSNFEFFKWDRIDVLGFVGSIGLVLSVIGLLYLVLNFGA